MAFKENVVNSHVRQENGEREAACWGPVSDGFTHVQGRVYSHPPPTMTTGMSIISPMVSFLQVLSKGRFSSAMCEFVLYMTIIVWCTAMGNTYQTIEFSRRSGSQVADQQLGIVRNLLNRVQGQDFACRARTLGVPKSHCPCHRTLHSACAVLCGVLTYDETKLDRLPHATIRPRRKAKWRGVVGYSP